MRAALARSSSRRLIASSATRPSSSRTSCTSSPDGLHSSAPGASRGRRHSPAWIVARFHPSLSLRSTQPRSGARLADADPMRVDWTALGEAGVDPLRRYLMIDTTNPPGNEADGATFLAAVLERGGIASEIVESKPGRANLMARLTGDGSLPGIVLHHHIDVVYADRRYWTVDPFGGVIRDGDPYGRGAMRWPDTAPNRLIRALNRLLAAERPLRVLPEVQEYFARLASVVPEDQGAGYDDLQKSLADAAFRARFLTNRLHAAMVRTTFAVTMLKGSEKSNVIPPEASATIDCRMLAGDDPQEIVGWIRRVIDDDRVEVTITGEAKVPNLSPVDTELYKALADTLRRRAPGAVVAPEILVAFTDNWVFRRCGLHGYGWSPFIMDEGEWHRVHGNDERLSLENIRAGARCYVEMLLDVAGA